MFWLFLLFLFIHPPTALLILIIGIAVKVFK